MIYSSTSDRIFIAEIIFSHCFALFSSSPYILSCHHLLAITSFSFLSKDWLDPCKQPSTSCGYQAACRVTTSRHYNSDKVDIICQQVRAWDLTSGGCGLLRHLEQLCCWYPDSCKKSCGHCWGRGWYIFFKVILCSYPAILIDLKAIRHSPWSQYQQGPFSEKRIRGGLILNRTVEIDF